MSLTLRYYQREAIEAVWEYLRSGKGKRPLVVIPTAGGKSLVITSLIQDIIAYDRDARILNLTHVPELIEQNYAELIGAWADAPAGIYSAKLGKRQIGAKIIFAGIQSIHRRAYNLQKIDFVLIDEAHLVPRTENTMYLRLIADLLVINPDLVVIGFTATPFRTDSGRLHEGKDALFDGVAYDINVGTLIREGYLTKPVTVPAKSQIDTTGIKIVAGEFNQAQLSRVANDPATIEAIAREAVSHSEGRKGILVFGCGKEHTKLLCDAIAELGIPGEVIFGDTPAGLRRAIVSRFKAQAIRLLGSMGVLTTGFNARHVDMIILARATKSLVLYIQIIGRGMRLWPGKEDCLVLDFGGNIERHGPIDNPKIRDERAPKKKDDPRSPTKYCIRCDAPNAISATVCSDCGMPFPAIVSLIDTTAASLEIVSMEAAAPREDIDVAKRSDLIPSWCDVNGVSYARHEKPGSAPTLRVTYQCGLLQHREWIAIEHPPGGARHRAVAWWRRRAEAGTEIPTTVDQALDLVSGLDTPRQIAVRPNGKHAEIIGHRYFGRETGIRAAS